MARKICTNSKFKLCASQALLPNASSGDIITFLPGPLLLFPACFVEMFGGWLRRIFPVRQIWRIRYCSRGVRVSQSTDRTWKTDRVGSRSDRWNGIWNSYLILFELKFDTNRCHHSPNLCSLFFAPPPPVPSFSHQLNTHILLAIYPLLHYTTHHEISSSTSPYHLKHSFCKVPVQLLYLKCLRAPCIACNNDI